MCIEMLFIKKSGDAIVTLTIYQYSQNVLMRVLVHCKK